MKHKKKNDIEILMKATEIISNNKQYKDLLLKLDSPKVVRLKKKISELQGKYRRSRAANSNLVRKIAQDRIIAVKEVVAETILNEKNSKVALKKKLKSGGCCLCEFNLHHRALDFHHVDKKTGNISAMSPQQIIKEIKTCKVVVLCSNCHRLLHAGVIKPDLKGKEIVI